jgi:hypothetical protein
MVAWTNGEEGEILRRFVFFFLYFAPACFLWAFLSDVGRGPPNGGERRAQLPLIVNTLSKEKLSCN